MKVQLLHQIQRCYGIKNKGCERLSNNINTFNDEQLQAINNIAQNAVATVTKGRLIQFLQGKKADLPELKVGEPAFCTDDFSFYLGSDDGNKRVVMEHEMGSMSVQAGSISFAKLDTSLQNQKTL